jgi:hypothetical protein
MSTSNRRGHDPIGADMTSPRPSFPGDLDRRAEDLYRRYGARPWATLPESTREHFRALVRAGIDGAGRPLH